MSQLPVAGYFRVSVAREGMQAPEMYTDEINRYCAYRGLILGQVFSDIDRSGFRGAKPRPGLEELKLRQLEFSSVIVPKLSRFARSVKELVELFDLFDSSGVALVFLDMNIDTSTSQGRLLRHIMAAFAEYESDVKADYARANHRLARSQGLPWGLPPFGYEVDRSARNYRVKDAEAKMVKTIFAAYSKGGISQYRIAKDLNEAGMLRPGHSLWNAKQVGRILDNPAYAARCIVDGKLVAAVWEPIVDDITWRRVREVRSADKRRISLLRAAKGGPYLLSGMLFCGYCGHRLVHRSTRNSDNGIYVCVEEGGKWCPGGSVACGRADEFVTQRFLERCHFRIEGKKPYGFSAGQVAWEKAAIVQRRSLLSLAITRVVLVPWPGGVTPCRSPGSRRELRIEWATGARDSRPLALLAQEAVDETRVAKAVSNGRAEMLRDLEAQVVRGKHEARSKRSSAYYQDWRHFQFGVASALPEVAQSPHPSDHQ